MNVFSMAGRLDRNVWNEILAMKLGKNISLDEISWRTRYENFDWISFWLLIRKIRESFPREN